MVPRTSLRQLQREAYLRRVARRVPGLHPVHRRFRKPVTHVRQLDSSARIQLLYAHWGTNALRAASLNRFESPVLLVWEELREPEEARPLRVLQVQREAQHPPEVHIPPGVTQPLDARAVTR